MQLPIRAIWVFHAAARAGSISRAAEELGVTPSAVSQQIQTLEIQLGVSLLNKSGRGVVLTEAGERYFSTISDEIRRIEEAAALVRGSRSTTSLTIRASPTLANKWLLPRLPSFLERHPGIEIRLDGTNEPTDFNLAKIDLEIRHGDGRWPGLFVEGMGAERFLPACAPGLASFGSLRPGDLADFRLIHSVKSLAQWSRWFELAGITPETRWRRLLFDRSHMAIDAAANGMGIALESTMLMERELASGRLVCPVRDAPPLSIVTQWIVCPREHLRSRKVQLFLDWLREQRDGRTGRARASATPDADRARARDRPAFLHRRLARSDACVIGAGWIPPGARPDAALGACFRRSHTPPSPVPSDSSPRAGSAERRVSSNALGGRRRAGMDQSLPDIATLGAKRRRIGYARNTTRG